MIKIEMKCYPDTTCENNLTIKIGTLAEIAPNQKNFDPDTTYGYVIETDRKGCYGYSYHGGKDYFKTQAEAMLRAISYGNGGFPLEHKYIWR